MTDRLKIGLIGAGVFAGYHANKLAAHPRVAFTGIVDQNEQTALVLAQKHGVQVLSLEALLAKSDAIVIASPASSHSSIALDALSAGCHCLIEKPLVTSADDADAILELKNSMNLVVQVGHQERMVLRAIGLMDVDERPVEIETVRNVTYSKRGTDTSVTMDLMTHDIDLCTALMGGPPDKVEGKAEIKISESADKSVATLYYTDCIASLESSRVADLPERRMRLTYVSGVVEIDFNAKTLHHTTSFALNTEFGADPQAADSLGSATNEFIQAVLDGTPVLVTAEEGAIAVKTALAIDRAI